MQFDEYQFAGAGGYPIYLRRWRPSVPARASLVLSHGLGEHCGRYEHVARRLVESGVTVYGHDHQGHGKSGGTVGTVENFEDFLEDLATVIGRARSENEGKRLFLLGHSMGGLIATAYVLEKADKPDCLILSGPAIVPLMAAGERTIDATKLSRDPEMQKLYLTDPLVLRERVKDDLYGKLADGLALLPGRAGEISMPILLLHGGDDALCSAEGAEAYVRSTAGDDITVKIYPGGRHESFNEINREQVLEDLVSWVEARIV